MTLEESLYAFLVNDATVNGLMNGQVYPVVIPEPATKTPPLLVYRRSGRAATSYTLEGEAWMAILIELSTWHTEYNAVKVAANAVAEALLAAPSGPLSAGGPTVDGITFESEEDDFIEDPLLFGVRQTFKFLIDP